MKKIKILQVVGALRTGGLETVAMNFFRYADREKYEFHFLSYQEEKGEYEDEIIKLGGKIIKIPAPKKGIKSFVKNVKKVMRENGPYQIVHSHTFYNSGIILWIAAKMKIPVRVAHMHNNHSVYKIKMYKKAYNFIMKMMLNKYSTKKCACSFEAGISTYGKRSFEKKGIIIKNCIDVTKYAFNQENREKIRKEFDIEEGDIVIGNVGRLAEAKNQKFLIEIVSKIEEKNIKLMIVGDGPLKQELIKNIEEHRIQDRVILAGNRDNVNEILSAFDLFLLPSRNEGFGIVLLEAQANGLRCIASSKRVPQSVKVLDNFDYVDLKENINIWIEKIKDNEKMARVRGADKILIENGFDIRNFNVYINELYTKI